MNKGYVAIELYDHLATIREHGFDAGLSGAEDTALPFVAGSDPAIAWLEGHAQGKATR